MPSKKSAERPVQAPVTISIPAVLQIQEREVKWVGGNRLPEWERVTSKLLGISLDKLRNSSVSKTLDSCGEPPKMDFTDVDESF